MVDTGFQYVPIAYYATPEFSKRLFCLLDEEKELEYQHTDTFHKQVVILHDYMPLQVRDFADFTAAHPVFLLYGEEPGYANNWLPVYLSLVASVQSVAVEPSQRLYLVTMKGESSR